MEAPTSADASSSFIIEHPTAIDHSLIRAKVLSKRHILFHEVFNNQRKMFKTTGNRSWAAKFAVYNVFTPDWVWKFHVAELAWQWQWLIKTGNSKGQKIELFESTWVQGLAPLPSNISALNPGPPRVVDSCALDRYEKNSIISNQLQRVRSTRNGRRGQ